MSDIVEKGLGIFLDDKDEYVASVAAEVKQIEDDFQNKLIDESTKRELLADVVELAETKEYADMLDTKVKVEKLLDFLKVIAKVL